MLVVPLMIGPRVVGALSWATAESGRRLGPADLETATLLAADVAVAVENARTRHTLVTAATLDRGDPRAGLALLDAALQSESTLALCSVAVVVVRDAATIVLSAGHPLPLVLCAGVLHEVEEPSPMLGAAPPGDRLVRAVDAFERGPQADDRAQLALHWTP